MVNELLSEAWAAQQVVTFYAELDAVRQKLFIAEGAELPAIAGKLSLDAAANTPTSFNMVGIELSDAGHRRVGDVRVPRAERRAVGGLGDRLDAPLRVTGPDEPLRRHLQPASERVRVRHQRKPRRRWPPRVSRSART